MWKVVDLTITAALCLVAAYAIVTSKASEATVATLLVALRGLEAARRDYFGPRRGNRPRRPTR